MNQKRPLNKRVNVCSRSNKAFPPLLQQYLVCLLISHYVFQLPQWWVCTPLSFYVVSFLPLMICSTFVLPVSTLFISSTFKMVSSLSNCEHYYSSLNRFSLSASGVNVISHDMLNAYDLSYYCSINLVFEEDIRIVCASICNNVCI